MCVVRSRSCARSRERKRRGGTLRSETPGVMVTREKGRRVDRGHLHMSGGVGVERCHDMAPSQ